VNGQSTALVNGQFKLGLKFTVGSCFRIYTHTHTSLNSTVNKTDPQSKIHCSLIVNGQFLPLAPASKLVPTQHLPVPVT